MREEKVRYFIDQEEFLGHIVYPNETQASYPAILIAHAWRGQDTFARKKAEELAELGYIGFAIDVYGQGKEVETDEEAQALMLPLFKDRFLLQKRVKAAYETIRFYPGVDVTQIGAIGFCFGGLTVIELLRSGADVKGVVSFHGVLGNQIGDHRARTCPLTQSIKGSLLILHGYEDPLVSLDDILAIQKEMTEAKVDWQMNIYGHTSHAFTNPHAHNTEKGLIFNPQSASRAWQAMGNFFDEIFDKDSSKIVI